MKSLHVKYVLFFFLSIVFRASLCDINDKLPTNALQFFIIQIKLLHVLASNDHLQRAIHILQKHQIDILQCRLYLSGPKLAYDFL